MENWWRCTRPYTREMTSSSSRADGFGFHDSLAIHPYYPSLLAGLLGRSLCRHRADVCHTGTSMCRNLQKNVTYEFVLASPAEHCIFGFILFEWFVRWEASGRTAGVAYYDVTVQHINHYTLWTPPSFCIFLRVLVLLHLFLTYTLSMSSLWSWTISSKAILIFKKWFHIKKDKKQMKSLRNCDRSRLRRQPSASCKYACRGKQRDTLAYTGMQVKQSTCVLNKKEPSPL